jgi:formylglycine-generating enzyme required for sulfatase activity
MCWSKMKITPQKLISAWPALTVTLGILFLFNYLAPRDALSAERDSFEKRFALIVANAAYPEAPTTNPAALNDAKLLSDELRQKHFEIDLKTNAGKKGLLDAIEALEKKVTPGTVVALYFNGIAIQIMRQTYLIPVDAQIWSETDVKRDGISLDAVLNELSHRGASVKVAIIDASRRNPFERRFRAGSAGLAAVDSPEGTLTMFAAAPGKLTDDSSAEKSLFMLELVKGLRDSTGSAEDVFGQARLNVSKASHGEQVPWVSSSLAGNFSFDTPYKEGNEAPVQTASDPPEERSQPRVTTSQPEPKAASDGRSQPAPAPAPAAAVADAAPLPAKPASRKPKDVFRDCPDCPEMVVIPPGTFTMGSPSSPYQSPIHFVVIERPLAVGRTAVTFDDWGKCVADSGCTYTPIDQGWGTGTRPVINISWVNAKEYIAWLSAKTGHAYRLPSEAEWEYAARAGTTTAFYWGASVGVHMANCKDCETTPPKRTLPVASYAANPFGLFDMGGNVAQWVEDCWNNDYKGAPRDGSPWLTGDCNRHVLRGGSYSNSSADISPSARFRYDSDVHLFANGFRVVRDLP